MSPLTPQTTLSLGRAPPNMPATPVAKTSTAITRPPLIATGYRETQRYKVRMPCMHALLSLGLQEPSRSATILNVLLSVPGMLFQDSAKYVDLLAPITFAAAPSPSPWRTRSSPRDPILVCARRSLNPPQPELFCSRRNGFLALLATVARYQPLAGPSFRLD